MSSDDRKAEVYRDAKDDVRVRVDAPGIAAVSAKIDPAAFIRQVAEVAGLTVTIG